MGELTMKQRLLTTCIVFAAVSIFPPAMALAQTFPEPNFTVAFTGDTGAYGRFVEVDGVGFYQLLQLVQDQDADLLVISGDYNYRTGADDVDGDARAYFEDYIEEVFDHPVTGKRIPVIGSAGNHDAPGPILGGVDYTADGWSTFCDSMHNGEGCLATYLIERARNTPGMEIEVSQINSLRHDPFLDSPGTCNNNVPGDSGLPNDDGIESWTVTYKGMKFVMLGQYESLHRQTSRCGSPGEAPTEEGQYKFLNYLNNHLPDGSLGPDDQYLWKVCDWHKNGLLLEGNGGWAASQVGGKGAEMDTRLYQACIDQGAIIAQGHEHSYERTVTVSNVTPYLDGNSIDWAQHPAMTYNGFANVPSNPNSLLVGPKVGSTPGRSFLFVSGSGGYEYRNHVPCENSVGAGFYYPYGCEFVWAKVLAYQQLEQLGVTSKPESYPYFGALFITFNVNGDPYQAVGQYIDISGRVHDSFTIRHTGGVAPPPPSSTPMPPPQALEGDMDGDLDVDMTDYQSLIDMLFQGKTLFDLARLIANFGMSNR